MRRIETTRTTYVQPTTAYVAPRRPTRISLLIQAFLALAGGFLLSMALLFILVARYNSQFGEKVFSGVRVGGIDVSGLPLSEAEALLAMRLDYPTRGQVVLQEGGQTWIARPVELGLVLDARSSALAAYNVGRSGGFFNRLAGEFSAWYSGVNLSPVFIYNEQTAQEYIHAKIAPQIDKPIIEASLGVNGVEVMVRSGQVGRTLDVPATLDAIGKQLNTLTDGIIPLVVKETPPVILDVTEQAELARRILSAPLVLSVPDPAEGDPGPWTIEPAALANMLTIQRVEKDGKASYQVALDMDKLRPTLESIVPKLARYPQNARFIFNDDTRQLDVIQKAVIGRSVNVAASLQAINEKIVQGEHNLALTIEYSKPAAGTNATADQLGIHELVSSYTSYFYGSSAARIQNIEIASSRFHGLLVAPGEVFSMANVLGDVSLDNGYAEALIIIGGRTIQGVGGGVCQVSTTLFRTVFFGGYPVVERYPHAYRVGYYEQTASGGYDSSLAGMDATVFVPMVDFKFTNDTPYWLLMETYVNAKARTLTWKFYSTSDGRKVEWDTTGPRNVVEAPPPLYEENPDLAKGEIKQVDWEAEGADVTVTRTVTRAGEVLFQDTFTTHYMPWRAVYQYGPGTKDIPTPEPTEER
jgi:vancomycin resistance protein YoaR